MEKARIQKSLAVIGAGAGGLVVGHRFKFSESTVNFKVVIYEQAEAIGGTWIYRDDTGPDSYGLPCHSSMYKYLRTNLPKEVMAFLDFPFPEDGNSYLFHYEVLNYLQDYCNKFNIDRDIKFRTKVMKVSPLYREGSFVWEVVVKNVLTKQMETNYFDAVAVCNGHYSVPVYPDIPGMDSFGKCIQHSHDYRVPDLFSGMVVVILGAGPSGVDIAIEVAAYAKEVILCHKLPWNLRAPLPHNVRQMPWVVQCSPGVCLFENEENAAVDAIIICTGYELSFPFLSPECGVEVVERQVTPLYKHLLHTKYPSMAFFGIPFGIIPFPFMDIQAQMFLKVLDGSVILPSEAAMNEDTAREMEEFLKSGGVRRHFHRMGPKRFQSVTTDMTTLFQLKALPSAIHKLFHMLYELRRENLLSYRDINYRITEDEVFRKN